MKIRTNLPECIKKFNYAKNSHYIELENFKGQKTRLEADALIKGVCEECEQEFFVKSNMGLMICPHCCSKNVKWKWLEPQLSFVPTKKESFVCPINEDKKGEENE